MIFFIHKEHQAFTHKALLRPSGADDFSIISYNRLLGKISIPRGTYVFMDRERMDQWELRIFGQLYNHLKNAGPGYRVVNNPARMMNRLELLRMLYREGINKFNVYPVSECQKPVQYPVFIRRIYDHKTPVTGLLHNEQELGQALAELRAKNEPDEGLIIVEFCAQPVKDTLFRKLSAFRVGDKVFFYQTVHQHDWLIKFGTKNSATPELYLEEHDMIKTNAFGDELRHVFELANIEYGRADFGLVNGKVQIYEINTNPHIIPPFDHPDPVRVKSMQLGWDKYMQAINDLDTTEKSAPKARLFHHPDVNNILMRFCSASYIRRR